VKRYLLLALLAGCAAEPDVVVLVPAEPEPIVEPRGQFTDDNIPYDLTAGADLTAIPDYWVEIFCTLTWEKRAEPFTGVEQWNPCLRPDMFSDGPRPEAVADVQPEALDLADPLATARAQPIAPVQIVPEPVLEVPVQRRTEFDIAPDPTLFLNPDGSFSRRAQ